MATHDYVIANGTGAAVRSDLNNALAAIVSNNSSSTEPGTTYAYQWWADTNANVLKLRNSSNDGWVTLRELDGTMLILDGSAALPGLAFADDVNTGIFSPAADTIGFATGGAERLEIANGEVVFNDPSNDVDFRVESNTISHMLFVDAGNDRVGIGASSPARTLDVNGFIRSDGTDGGLSFGGNSSTPSEGASIHRPANNTLAFVTDSSEAARIDSSGRLLVGTSADRPIEMPFGNTLNSAQPGKLVIEDSGAGHLNMIIARENQSNQYGPAISLVKSRGTSDGSYTVVQSGDNLGTIQFGGADGSADRVGAAIVSQVDTTPGSDDMPGRLLFATTSDGSGHPTERLRINSEGKIQVTGTRAGSLQASDNDSLELFTSASNGSANTGCGLSFYNNDGNGSEIGGTIQVAKENSSINNTAGYMRFCTRPNASDVTERMRIGSGGDVLISRTSASISNVGHYFLSVGAFNHTRNADTVGVINRLGNDGTLIGFRQADNLEGSISVSGSTVSYNGGHLARWSQLASGAERTEILRGSVLSNLDEMCEWAYEAQDAVLYTEEDELPEGVSVGDVKTPAKDAGTEDNEQLNRMKVSDVEGDVNVSGVFQAWDDDDDTYTNDFYCAMTGDFVIRIAQGTTVARGDLLMSAGDGTAKPQDDDIVRSKTIAKVTSTTVSTTYSDGSYCVPCVLMAC